MRVVLEEEDEVKLRFLTSAMTASRMCGKSTYTTWIHIMDEGHGSRSGYVLEALLTFWLLLYVLPSSLKDGLDQICVPLSHTNRDGGKAYVSLVVPSVLIHTGEPVRGQHGLVSGEIRRRHLVHSCFLCSYGNDLRLFRRQ